MQAILGYLNDFLVIIGSIASVYGVIRTWQYWQRISWGRVGKAILRLRDKLVADNYVPTLIVGIGRGGAVVGALISGVLGGTPMVVCERKYHWTEDRGRIEEIILPPQITECLERVLLVAGEVHSGNTMRVFVDFLRGQGGTEVRTYGLYKALSPTFNIDYWSIETNRYLVLPWMLTREYPHHDREAKLDRSGSKHGV